MADERQFERISIPVNLEYTVPEKGWIRGESISKDISLGGVRFQIPERIALGTR
ncbi:MAG: PilZ domain-containing protein, partial [Bacteroidetes bacterium]|nr:PilZ domain-containing protein [Bacteroidota bacterium]